MKITGARTHILQATLSQPLASSRAWYDKRTAMLVEIETDQGIVGWGECYGPARITAAVVESVVPWLIGQDPLRTDYLWQMIYAGLRDHGQKGVVIQGLSGIDIALWDIKGKHFGVPVQQLLGGARRTEFVAYATGLLRRKTDDQIRSLAEEAAGYVAEGFSAVKLKVGFGVEEDAVTTRAIREAIGPTAMLMVDANHAYDCVAAIRLGRMIEHHDIGWFEEPVPPEDVAGYLAVRSALSIPIAGGECEFTRFGFRDLFVSRALDIAQPDTCAAGGLSECKKIADMAEAFGVRCNPHVWGTGIAIAASLHLLAVLPPHSPLSLKPIEPMFEFDRTEYPIRQAILVEPIEHTRGIVRVPDGSGLGIEIDRKALVRFAAH
ncbi:mandelate racemase/muconate lactonizing enzyme family protein [Bradyrhizobium canariense]|uniref:Mandelate racemase n=1 Tax=Bradyrhizobium canariense TaxID=255045 RepID=A0A1X3H7E6_9BRAD|nr:mandelate racemase/muconate lactonizing enzyme family protein [Bradyrhizobium canariense]OSI71056.1 mandelate racemase [Bradyrhizobium canariense]OSI79562.1 mandelate racemase [Bradyrhizobium canariense]OSI91247.1 mandelate racemase [Bradyrhizobium canariense]OSI91872.1 mandelate racemase [Bradyrhizobium canariense]OSJ05681.1 mandelate racemase [Bradyrhizobium canariense]